MSGDLRQITYSVVGHLDCKTDCYIPNLTTISRSPPNHGDSRLHHATISPSLRTLSLTHTLTRTTKLTLRFQPACMSCRIGSAQAGVWASDSLRVIHVPSSDGAGELRRGRSALHWRLWHAAVRLLGSVALAIWTLNWETGRQMGIAFCSMAILGVVGPAELTRLDLTWMRTLLSPN